MKNKFTVGQPLVFRQRNGRGGLKDELIDATIKTIGKKYLTVESNDYGLSQSKIEIETLVQVNTQYQPNYYGFISREAIQDKIETDNGIVEIRRQIGQYGTPKNITVDQVRAILAILKPIEK